MLEFLWTLASHPVITHIVASADAAIVESVALHKITKEKVTTKPVQFLLKVLIRWLLTGWI